MIRALFILLFAAPAWSHRYVLLESCSKAKGQEAFLSGAIARISRGTKRGCSTLHYGGGTAEVQGTVKQLLCRLHGDNYCVPTTKRKR